MLRGASQVKQNRRAHGALVATIFALLAVGAHGKALAANAIHGYYEGDAFGSFGTAGAQPISAELGRSAYLNCPCTGTNGVAKTNGIAAVQSNQLLITGAIQSSAITNETATKDTVKVTSRVLGLKLLGGLITADEVVSVAATTGDADEVTTSANGSRFTKLKVGGLLIADDVAANTTLLLPGIGKVVLRETKRRGDGIERRGIIVNMLHVYVTQAPNSLGLPAKTELIVAHANSGWVRGVAPILFGGGAWIADSKTSTPLVDAQIGFAAPTWVGCEGTGGTRTNSVAGLAFPGVVSSGQGDTSAFAGVQNGVSVSRTSAQVAGLDLLNGLISADLVKASSKSTLGNGQSSVDTGGSTFVNLVVDGLSIEDDVAPNTQIDLPGLGYVRLYETSSSASAAEVVAKVRMIHVVVTQPNGLGLPVGSELSVAVANSRVKPL